ncbi:MAG: hypothetical protein QOD39_2728, partial [Mycobacterium sp.]|nr:hypothetical protein [Mycobacterium sp.]
MVGYDPKVYRNLKDGVGSPGDPLATDSTSSWTMVALLKGIYALLTTGNTAGATAAKQDTGNTSLSSVDTKMTTLLGYVDGLETLQTAMNGFVDGLEALAAAATPAGTNLIGRAAVDATAATGGIATTARMASAAASTNATNVKTSAGRVYAVQGINKAAYDVFLVLYDSAANPPVPGTTTIRKKIPLAASSAFTHQWPVGLSFGTGIGYAFTKLPADADTTVLV